MRATHKLIMIAIIIIAAGAIQAADRDFGIRLGLNRTTLTNMVESKGRNGLMAGVYIDDRLSNFYALHIEFNFIDRKSKSLERIRRRDPFQDDYSGGYSIFPITVMTETNYIDLAALFKLFPPGMSRTMPYIYGGPVFSILIVGRRTEIYSRREVEYDVDSQRGVISYAFGGGIDFNVKGLKSSLDIRMTRAVTTFTDSNYNPGYKNNFISATVGVCLSSR